MITFNDFFHDKPVEVDPHSGEPLEEGGRVYTIQDRIKLGRRMKKLKNRIQKAKARKMKRKASQAVLDKRAQKSARNVFKKRFGQGKAYKDLSAGQKQIVDKKVNVKKPAIGRLKKRLVKVKRKLDIGRKR